MARVQQPTPDLPAYKTSRVTSFVGDRRGLSRDNDETEREECVGLAHGAFGDGVASLILQ
jgi:hypothetical protein